MANDRPGRRVRAPEEVRPVLEVFVVAFLWAAAVLALAGVVAVAFLPGRFAVAGRTAEAVALLVAVSAIALSTRITTLRSMRADVTGGRSYDALRGESGLRFASAFVQLVQIAALTAVVLRLADAVGLVELEVRPAILANAVRALLATLALAVAAALSQSLRTATPRPRTPLGTVLAGLSLGLAGLLGLLGVANALGRTAFLQPTVDLELTDTGIILLAGYVCLAFGLVRLRGLPTLTWLMYDQPDADRGRAAGAGRPSVILVPAILAFALLLVIFLLFLLFGLGVGDLILAVGQNPLLLGVLGFLVLALVGSLAVAFTLSRTAQGDRPLYTVVPDAEARRIRLIVATSAVASMVLFVLAFLSFRGLLDRSLWLHALCLGLLVAVGPYGFYAAHEHKRVRRLEERFPDFLRDIASSHKGGLTLHQAASIAAKGEYGELTPEVRKMADQLSWNVSFSEALERFADRVQTPLVQRAVSLILQADRSGGSTTDVLLAAARDAREIKNLENERRITMGLYTVVVYITFFVFLGVAAILYSQFAPQIVAASQAVDSLGGQASEVEGLGGGALRLEQYQLFYFLAAVVQGLGDGVVAGLLGSGRAVLGLRHGFAMVLASYVTFAFLL
jgi:archaeal flagellar protein FlaJ